MVKSPIKLPVQMINRLKAQSMTQIDESHTQVVEGDSVSKNKTSTPLAVGVKN